jgi:hypothetical protein
LKKGSKDKTGVKCASGWGRRALTSIALSTNVKLVASIVGELCKEAHQQVVCIIGCTQAKTIGQVNFPCTSMSKPVPLESASVSSSLSSPNKFKPNQTIGERNAFNSFGSCVFLLKFTG